MSLSDDVYKQVLVAAHYAGREAAYLQAEQGVTPLPPADISSGSALTRSVAMVWYQGYNEVVDGKSALTWDVDAVVKDFREELHPRGPHGRFISTGGHASPASKPSRARASAENSQISDDLERIAQRARAGHQHSNTLNVASEGRPRPLVGHVAGDPGKPSRPLASHDVVVRMAARSKVYTDQRMDEALKQLNSLKAEMYQDQSKDAKLQGMFHVGFVIAGFIVSAVITGGAILPLSIAAAVPLLMDLSKEITDYHHDSPGDSIFSRIGYRLSTKVPFIPTATWLPNSKTEKDVSEAPGIKVPGVAMLNAIATLENVFISGGVSPEMARVEANGFVRLAIAQGDTWPDIPALPMPS